MTACLLHTKLGRFIAAFIFLSIVFVPTMSRGELVDHFAQAMTGYAGSVTFSGGLTLPTVSVEYAVFAPGSFGSGDPSGGQQYVYAYQILGDVSNSVQVSKFTVGLDAGADATGIGELNDSGAATGFAASSYNITTGPTTNSAVWNYNPRIPLTDKSKLLLFVSPFEPKWLTCTVKGAATAETGPVPSPVPEPGTLLCLTLAGIALILVRPIRLLVR
jgi:hypothetical protein